MADSVTLEVFTDFVCPWCYLSTPRIERLREKFEIDIQWVYFPLHPETPREGLLLTELFKGRNFDLEAAHARLKSLLDSEGLPFHSRTHTFNSRLAQELAKAFDAVRDPLYREYFEHSRNIADPEVLVEVARCVGVDEGEARSVLADRTFSQAVDEDWEKARLYGISGVPSFVAGNRKLTGAHPFDVLERFVIAANARPRLAGNSA